MGRKTFETLDLNLDGRLMTTLATDQKSMQVHHTEYTMPVGGLVFANDHRAGRTRDSRIREPSARASEYWKRGGDHAHGGAGWLHSVNICPRLCKQFPTASIRVGR
jgi:hypothetical protein